MNGKPAAGSVATLNRFKEELENPNRAGAAGRPIPIADLRGRAISPRRSINSKPAERRS
jgi:hypothetical protein